MCSVTKNKKNEKQKKRKTIIGSSQSKNIFKNVREYLTKAARRESFKYRKKHIAIIKKNKKIYYHFY